MDRIEQIRAAHLAARPKPAVNPAWANAERDIGVLLAEIARLREALEFYATGKNHHGDILTDRGDAARAAIAKNGSQS